MIFHEKDKHGKQFFIKLLLLVVVFFSINAIIPKVLEKLFCEPFLYKVSSSSKSTFAFFLLIIWYLIWVINQVKQKEIINQNFLLFSTSLTVVYAIDRFGLANSYWDFTKIDSFECLNYADLLLIILALNIISLIVLFFILRKKVSDDQKDTSVFAKNKEINSKVRKGSAERLAEEILKIRSEEAFAVGVVGAWGSGKTKFLKYMEDYLEEKAKNKNEEISKEEKEENKTKPENTKENVKIIEFKPWLIDDSDKIIPNFFELLGDSLSEKGELKSLLKEYLGLITNANNESFAIKIFNSIFSNNNINDIKKSIEDYLFRKKIKLIIFIDDLDRLEKEEILKVFKLIRSISNFKNSIFILAYDKNHLIESIKDSIKSEQYIDKIIQFEKHLPIITNLSVKETLKRDIYLRLEKLSTEKDLNELKDKIVEIIDGVRSHSNTKGDLISELFDSYRDIEKFASSFVFAIKENWDIISDIDLEVLFHLEILKIKNNLVYDSIYTRKILQYNVGDIGIFYSLDLDKLKPHKVEISNSENTILKRVFAKELFETIKYKIYKPNHFHVYFGESVSSIEDDFIDEFLNQSNPAILRNNLLHNLKEEKKQFALRNFFNEKNKIFLDNIILKRYFEIIIICIELNIKIDVNFTHQIIYFSDYVKINKTLLGELEKLANEQLIRPNENEFIIDFLFELSDELKNINDLSKSLLKKDKIDEIIKKEFINTSNSQKKFNKILKFYLDLFSRSMLRENSEDVFNAFSNYLSINQEMFIENLDKFLETKNNLTSFKDFFHHTISNYASLSGQLKVIEGSNIKRLEFLTFYKKYEKNGRKPTSYQKKVIEIVSDLSKFTIKNNNEFIYNNLCLENEKLIDDDFRFVDFIPYKNLIEGLNFKFETNRKNNLYKFQNFFYVPSKMENIESAELKFIVDDYISIKINDKPTFSETTNFYKTPETIDVLKDLEEGNNKIEFTVTNIPASTSEPKENLYGFAYMLRIKFKEYDQ